MRHLWSFALLSLSFGVLLHAKDKPKPPPDFTNAKPEDFGVKPVKPIKDAKTGFLVGGTNDTALIRKLTEINGKSIDELEKRMRPGQFSGAGFLGKDEKLLDVLAADNDFVVGQLRLTHQEIATQLHLLAAIGDNLVVESFEKKENKLVNDFTYRGRRFRIEMIYTRDAKGNRGFQESPFEDGTKSGANVKLTNLDNSKTLEYARLVPYMVERYGFYEGKGTPYRVEPKQIVEVLDFLKKPTK